MCRSMGGALHGVFYENTKTNKIRYLFSRNSEFVGKIFKATRYRGL